MKVLVTGHQGYIGTRMVPYLLEQGFDVVGMDCGFFEDCRLFPTRPTIPELLMDVRDVTPSDLHGIDAVIHLAALSNDPLGDLDADWTFDINHRGSVHLAECAKAAGVGRFVFSSSCSMYGVGSDDRELTEEAEFNPVTPYAESKVLTERDLRALADDDFSPTFMRNATCYGVSPRLRADVVLNNLSAWAVTTGKIRILSDGTPWRPLVHIEDLTRAFVCVLRAERDQIHAEAFNVGVPGHNYRVRQIAEAVHRVQPSCEIEFAGESGADPRNYRVDFTKLVTRFPDYAPEWDVESGARELYDAYLDAGLTLDRFQGTDLIRLNQLKALIEDGELDRELRWVSVLA
ncbi:MAG: SDR family oxidoreductase [Planctomycetes bacterium]|nr:SDR family oxidoreductase [Planctomycetota bacterium]